MSFSLFMALWNRLESRSTPAVHFQMAEWLQQNHEGGPDRMLLMAFRACGKSSVVGLYAAWRLLQNPVERILVLSADDALARKMVRQVRRIIERHPLCEPLIPERADQWAADRFTVRRTAEWRDPSMLARGIAANLTGCRADLIICDDVEVPNTCDTACKRDTLRRRLREAEFILTPGGTQLYIGTPHTYHSIYSLDLYRRAGRGSRG